MSTLNGTSAGTNLNTMKWLIKREFWEHKGGFFWAPIVVAIIMFFFMFVAQVGALSFDSKVTVTENGKTVQILGKSFTPYLQERLLRLNENEKEKFGSMAILAEAAPLLWLLALTTFFACLNSLYDERKDRSVLFWKSLPVSDGATVVSKTALALVIAPLITLGIVSTLAAMSALLICIGLITQGIDFATAFRLTLGNLGLYSAPLKMAALIPLYALWALPTVGWLLFVSAFANTKPILWALGTPLLAAAIAFWANNSLELGWNLEWLGKNILIRLLGSIIPGHWISYLPPNDVIGSIRSDPNAIFAYSWGIFGTTDLWAGVLVGVGMIYAAIRVRRWKNEG